MKNVRKKLLAVGLTLAAVSASFVPIAASASEFSDVSKSSYYYTAVKTLNEMGIIEGYPDGTYLPSQHITRAEMAAIICRVQGYADEAEDMAGRTDYTDVASDHWASGYINKATDEGIICGDGDGTFRPEDDVNYEEAVKMVICAVGRADEAISAGGYPYGYLSIANGRLYTQNVKGAVGTASSRGDIALLVYNSQTADLTPVPSLKAGRYFVKQTLALSTGYDDAVIYYTINGKDPLSYGKVYSGEFEISDIFTLKAVAVRNGFTSDVASYGYTIKPVGGGKTADDVTTYRLYVDIDDKMGSMTPSSSSSHLSGTKVTVIAKANDGYVFEYWEASNGGTFADETASTTTFTMPSKSTTITPVFSKLHTVSFDLGYDAEAPETQYLKDGETITMPFISARSGYNFIGWYTDAEFTEAADFTAAVTEDMTLYAKWEEVADAEVIYTVQFDLNYEGSDNTLSVQSVAENSAATEPAAPSRSGYTFGGWFIDAECTSAFDFSTPVTADTTLYAKWDTLSEYSVTFNINDGASSSITLKVTDGVTVSRLDSPEREGCVFTGWYIDEECTALFDFDTPITEDTVLYAGWNTSHTVTFYHHEDAVETQTVTDGAFAAELTPAETEGYEFMGWYTDSEYTTLFDFHTPITEDITLYAKWEDTTDITVTYNLNYTDSEITTISVKSGTALEKPDDPVRSGYTFSGWYTDAACTESFDFTSAVTADTVIYAKWEEIKTYTVTFNANCTDATNTPVSQTVAAGSKAIEPNSPVRTGYKFSGWCTDAACTTTFYFTSTITADITLYAKWEKIVTYTVTFSANGKDASDIPSAKTIPSGSTISEPDEPTCSGYTFGGWYTDAACTTAYSFNKSVTADITLYAKWIETTQYTVSFNLNYDGAASSIAAQTVNSGATATEPTAPTRSGYAFGGWYTEAAATNPFSFSTAITSDTTLWAGWSEIAESNTTDNSTADSSDNTVSVDTADIELGALSVDRNELTVNTSETVVFTVSVKNANGASVCIYAENGSKMATMYDDGTNGDKSAGDGVYTFTSVFNRATTGTFLYYAAADGVQSDPVAITFVAAE